MELNTEWCSEDIENYADVETIKKKLEKSNKCYLNNHPEIRAILRVLLQNAVEKEPKNVYKFVADMVDCRVTPLIIEMINRQLKVVKERIAGGKYAEYDADSFIKKKESTHSLQSVDSIAPAAESILRYALVFPTSDNCDDF